MNPSISRSSLLGAVTLATLLPGCGAKLPQETEKVDLTQSGMAVTLEAPRGATKTKERTSASLEWGTHAEAGRLSLTFREAELKCTGLDENCKILEQTPTSILKETTFMKKTHYRGLANVKTGGTTLGCEATAHDADDVRRLLAACQTVTATGPLVSATTITSASSAKAAPAAPLVLEDVHGDAKDMKGAFTYTIRAPKGHTVRGSGAYQTYGSPAGTPLTNQVSVSVSPYKKVTSLASAEKEAGTMNLTGLETIADRRELTKTSFLVATAPRGTGGFMTLYVYASGKKRSAMAKCWGPASVKASLEEMCTSLQVD